MSISEHVRRAAVLATVAVAFGATAAAAASPTPPDDAPPATSETPASPIETAPTVATDDVDATSDPATTLDLTPSTKPVTTPDLAPSTTPVSTSAPGKPPTSTVPAAAIATTTQPPANDADVAALAMVVASAPRSPVAKPGNGAVTLTWQTPASNGGATIDKYAVQRSLNTMSGWSSIGGTTSLTYTATGLTNGTKYYFRVVAHNAVGFSPSSTVVNAVPRTIPSAPLSLVATPGNGSVKLTWLHPTSDGGATIDKHTVQRSGNGTSGWLTVGTPTGTSYTAGGSTNGTRYYFRVIAHNAGGNGKSSPVVDAVPRTVPSTPPDCSATQAYGPGTTIMWVAWSRPANDGVSRSTTSSSRRGTSTASPPARSSRPPPGTSSSSCRWGSPTRSGSPG